MDKEFHYNKRLREMFRLLQRNKKQRKKIKEALDDEEEQTPNSQPKKRASSRSPSRSESNRRKQYRNRRKIGADEEPAEEEEEVPVAAELSKSEKKRRRIRKKYGVKSRDEDFFQRCCKDDVEEFENVDAAIRPAATKMRQAKLRWKSVKDKFDEAIRVYNKRKKARAMQDVESKFDAPGSTLGRSSDDQTASDRPYYQLDSTQSSEEERALSVGMDPDQSTKTAEIIREQQEKICRLMKEVNQLVLRLADMEQIQQKATVTITKLRMDLKERDKNICELKNKIAFLEQKDTEKQEDNVMKNVDEDDKLTPTEEAVALRALGIMKRNQILEQILKPTETTILAKFFQENMSKPDKTIIQMIDKALAYGIEVLLMKPDLFDDVVDNELRIFMLDGAKAKRVLLDCMLLHPEYVPISWGGDVLTKRQQQRQTLSQTSTIARESNELNEKSSECPFFLPRVSNNELETKKRLEVDSLKTEGLDIAKFNPQKHYAQKKSTVGKVERIAQDDSEKQKRSVYFAVEHFPLQKLSILNSKSTIDSDQRVSRDQRSKSKAKRKRKKKESD